MILREREAQLQAEREIELQAMRDEQERLLAETAQRIIEDSMADEQNAARLKQAEDDKAELARKIAELESQIKSRDADVVSMQDTQASLAAARADEIEAERLAALKRAEELEQERFVIFCDLGYEK